MPLQVLPAKGPADMYRCAVIERHAYDTYPANGVLFPGPFPADVLATRGKELEAQCNNDDGGRGWMVYDVDSEKKANKICAAAGQPRRQEVPPGANVEAVAMFFGSLAGMQKRIMGDRLHIFLATLNTDPRHNRRGAGTLLLRWGLEEARKRGLPVYLHSSLQGHDLYLKHGFRDLEELVTDFSPWGLEERNYNWAMIKEP